MDHIEKFCKENQALCGALVTLIVVLIIYWYIKKEGFLGFVAAPIAAQRPGLLGVGGPIRFSSEFSSTNQGRDNIVSSTLNAKEGMVGHMEFPSIPYVSGEVNSYLQGVAATPAPSDSESFMGRGMFAEYYSNNVDNRLKGILAGGN